MTQTPLPIIRKVFNDDQVLMLFAMSCITLLVVVGLLMLGFAPQANGGTVVPLIALGIGAIATFVRQPAFPAAMSDTDPAVAAKAAAAVLDTASKAVGDKPAQDVSKPEGT